MNEKGQKLSNGGINSGTKDLINKIMCSWSSWWRKKGEKGQKRKWKKKKEKEECRGRKNPRFYTTLEIVTLYRYRHCIIYDPNADPVFLGLAINYLRVIPMRKLPWALLFLSLPLPNVGYIALWCTASILCAYTLTKFITLHFYCYMV